MDAMMKKIDEVLESERLVTARLVDSILRATQISTLATPEMQEMFTQWLSLIGDQVLGEIVREEEGQGTCDVPALARSIGVSETTLFSLLAFLHRSGKIRIRTMDFALGSGKNTEACDCLLKHP